MSTEAAIEAEAERLYGSVRYRTGISVQSKQYWRACAVESLAAGRSTDNAIARVLAAGWHVRNLFQRADGMWQANLWRPDAPHPALARDFGLAATPCGALNACIEKLGGLATPTDATPLSLL